MSSPLYDGLRGNIRPAPLPPSRRLLTLCSQLSGPTPSSSPRPSDAILLLRPPSTPHPRLLKFFTIGDWRRRRRTGSRTRTWRSRSKGRRRGWTDRKRDRRRGRGWTDRKRKRRRGGRRRGRRTARRRRRRRRRRGGGWQGPTPVSARVGLADTVGTFDPLSGATRLDPQRRGEKVGRYGGRRFSSSEGKGPEGVGVGECSVALDCPT